MIVYEDEIAIAEMPDKGSAKGHIIIRPKQKANSVEDMSENDLSHLFFVSSYAATTLFETLGAQGTNILTNNSGDGLEIHVIARYQGDSINFQWSPKQVPAGELDSITSSIAGKVLLEERPENPPKIPDQPEDKMSESEDKDNYLIKQLERIP